MARITDGPGFDDAAAEFDFVVLTLSRREVESGNVSDALDRLLNLSDARAHVLKFEDGLAIAFEPTTPTRGNCTEFVRWSRFSAA